MSAFRNLNPRARRMMAITNAALVVGLLLHLFVHPAGMAERDWLDAVVGFLLGLYIAVNLFQVYKARRSGNPCP